MSNKGEKEKELDTDDSGMIGEGRWGEGKVIKGINVMEKKV